MQNTVTELALIDNFEFPRELREKLPEDVRERELRVFGTHDEPWFIAKDVGDILGIQNIRDFTSKLNQKWVSVVAIYGNGGRRNMTVINEPGFYRLIMRSDKPIAEPFQEWVCQEVLPTIRKKGKYELETRIHELEATVQNLRYKRTVVNVRLTRPIRICDRLVHLGYITEADNARLLTVTTEEEHGYVITTVSVQGMNYKNVLRTLGRYISRRAFELYGKGPDKLSNTGKNYLSVNEYEDYGDDAIHDFVEDHPIETWGFQLHGSNRL